ncbi:MAG TPA: alpha/beta hydrolase [Rugosibacter sp.]
MIKPEIGFALINDTRFHFEQAGSGVPLILLHGLGLNLHMWDDQFSSFAAHYHVIRYDLRGFGLSLPSTPAAFSHAEDLKGLLDYLKIERAHVLGLSLGGRVALDFSLLYPDALDRLVLVDPVLGGYRFCEDWLGLMAPIMQYGKNGDVAAAKRLWLAHPLFAPVRAQSQSRQQFEQIAANDPGWHWLNQGFEQSLSPPATKRLQDVNAPALVVVGERDLPDFHAIAELLNEGLPHVQKIDLMGAGHMANMEAPEQFNEIVLKFLSRK